MNFFKKIIDVDFHPDEGATFPQDMKWLEKILKSLSSKEH